MGKQVGARFNGGVAQLGEHLPCKQGVKGSNPSISIRMCNCNDYNIRKNRFVILLYLENRILNQDLNIKVCKTKIYKTSEAKLCCAQLEVLCENF